MSIVRKLKHAFLTAVLAVNGLTVTSSAIRTSEAYRADNPARVDFSFRNAASQVFNSSSRENGDWVDYSMMTKGEREAAPPRNPSQWAAVQTAKVWRFLGDDNNTSLMNFMPGAVVSLVGLPGDLAGSAGASVYHAVKNPAPPKPGN